MTEHRNVFAGFRVNRTSMRLRAAGFVAALQGQRPSFRLLTLWSTLLAALAVLSAFAAVKVRFVWDLPITRAVQAINLFGFKRLGWIATFLSSPSISLLALGTAVALLLMARKLRLAFFAGASAWTHLLGALLKLLVDRPRPSAELIDVVRVKTEFSYPSGHVEWVMGFEGFLVFTVWRLTENRAIRAGAVAIWGLHLVLVGLGRVEQGLHWPSDVLAGYLVGAIALSVTVWAYRVFTNVRQLDTAFKAPLRWRN